MLCNETKLMAERLADSPREITHDGWRAGTVQWKLVIGQTHGFGKIHKKDAKEEDTREQTRTRMYHDISQWIIGLSKISN
jgi:hypothetical protein